MRFVNLTKRTVHTRFTGFIRPGMTVSGNKESQKLEDVLSNVVGGCGSSVGIVLSDREVNLLSALMSLDDLGKSFSPNDIPAEIREDPNGVKRAAEKNAEAQFEGIRGMQRKNAESMKREETINGEIHERHPVGMATMEGEPVNPSMLKTGFEKIMEENARIAAGQADGKKADAGEMLDPIGRHMTQPVLDPNSQDGEENGANDPAKERPGRGTTVDANKTLSIFSVFNDPSKVAPMDDADDEAADGSKAKTKSKTNAKTNAKAGKKKADK